MRRRGSVGPGTLILGVNHPFPGWPVTCLQKGSHPAVLCLCFWWSSSKSQCSCTRGPLRHQSCARFAYCHVTRGRLRCPCATGGVCFSVCPDMGWYFRPLQPQLPRRICHVAFMLGSPACSRCTNRGLQSVVNATFTPVGQIGPPF